MNEEKLWQFVFENTSAGVKTALLVVLESLGSSPGRHGFCMAITETELCGSIGGGIMEHKMVELVREQLRKDQQTIWIRKQIHSKEPAQNQSGMICSGEQTLACYFLNKVPIQTLESILHAIINREVGYLIFSESDLYFERKIERQIGLILNENLSVWQLILPVGAKPTIHIVGGGHVGLAFSRVMNQLSFHVVVYDNRPELNTLVYNEFAHEKQVVDYSQIGSLIEYGPHQYVAIMTFGYRTDGQVIRQLLGKNFAYLGLLGSRSKIEQMWRELEIEGFSKIEIDKVFAPVGLSIKSQTPEEIAISIAAQIIQIRNAGK